ncbi:MAG: DUF4892 domain-containing protein [Marinobacter sp.]|uniref:DUF4892 domain-containing protein n=1 Tax=Marinobacter sp. TaxID=50741 RepID=UPI0034A06529
MSFNVVGFVRASCYLLVLMLSVSAAQAAKIEPFPLATLEAERPIISPSHRILLSPVREVNNEIRSDSLVRLAVRGVGQRMQISPDSGRDEAKDYYLNELASRNAVILFDCTGRDCGRSNVWANQIFNEATLYGRDADQDYLAAAYRDVDDTIHVVLLYTVTRGNQREYVWTEQLSVPEGSVIPGFHASSTRLRGPIIVPWSGGVTYRFDWNANDRRLLQEWTQSETDRVVLVSYSTLGEQGAFEESMRRATDAVESMTVLLGKSGVRKDQITPIIVGPALAFTDPGRQGDRIEIMVVRAP